MIGMLVGGKVLSSVSKAAWVWQVSFLSAPVLFVFTPM